uniref:Reverse transcriptase domain-containing protein n=1 Tax=Cannabis sativa TaxID=3483 RepID=A0A803Q6R3_CANSA
MPLHALNKIKGRKGFMAIKTDMHKAYDRLEWEFLMRVLKANGFNDKFCKMIIQCVSTVSFSILLNGAPLKPFYPGRGLRQGDPLSPYLFILCSEVLSKLMIRSEARRQLSGIKIGKDSQPISHLFYADDVIFFCRANMEESEHLKTCFETYERWSGQQINRRKSGIVFSPKVKEDEKELVHGILNIQQLDRKEKYLGNPFFYSAKKREDFNFLKEKILARLEGWKAKQLSTAGRHTLISSVLQSIPCYTMSTIKIPVSICSELDSILARFWWKGSSQQGERYHAWKSWADCCQPKRNGGLGFRKFKDVNMALLAKMAWYLLEGENSSKAWVNILTTKYCKVQDFWSVEANQNDSKVWRGILMNRDLCVKNTGFLVGDGKIDIWTKPWVPRYSPEEVRQAFSYNVTHAFTSVADLFIPGTQSWNVQLIRQCFSSEVAEAILKIRPMYGSRDTMFWQGSTNGRFSVKSAYWGAQNHRFQPEKKVWKDLWKLKIHARQKMLLWRILNGCLPLKNRLGYVQESDKARVFCGLQTENDVHLFRDCHFARCLWFTSPWGVLNGNLCTLNFEEWFMWMLESKIEELILFGACVIEHIWQCRNNLIFKGCNPNLDQSIKLLKQRFKEFSLVLLQHSYSAVSNTSTLDSQVCWDVRLRVDASVQEGRAGLCAVQIQNVQEEGFVIPQIFFV